VTRPPADQCQVAGCNQVGSVSIEYRDGDGRVVNSVFCLDHAFPAFERSGRGEKLS
jgi:hypothetical protein